jgi:hypothetical protein
MFNLGRSGLTVAPVQKPSTAQHPVPHHTTPTAGKQRSCQSQRSETLEAAVRRREMEFLRDGNPFPFSRQSVPFLAHASVASFMRDEAGAGEDRLGGSRRCCG